MFWPCETRTSICRNLATISSGLYRFLAIAVLLDVTDIPQVGPLQWGRIIARARSTLAGSGNLERADAALAPVVQGHGLAFKAKSSLDERAGRADEPYSQRGD